MTEETLSTIDHTSGNEFDLLIVNQRAPYGSHHGHESLDLALASATFDQRIALLFRDDGVYQLLPNQMTAGFTHKNLNKMMSALSLFGIEHIYVCMESLAIRQLKTEDLIDSIPLETVTETASGRLYHKAKTVIRF